MTTKTDRPVHYRAAFVSHCACGALNRFGVRETRRVEDVTCRLCLREVRKPATTVEGALTRVRDYASRHHADPAVIHALVAALNDLVADGRLEP